jgi:hypothetical protein
MTSLYFVLERDEWEVKLKEIESGNYHALPEKIFTHKKGD